MHRFEPKWNWRKTQLECPDEARRLIEKQVREIHHVRRAKPNDGAWGQRVLSWNRPGEPERAVFGRWRKSIVAVTLGAVVRRLDTR